MISEPADPRQRSRNHLPPKTYAEAAEVDPVEAEPAPINEDLIKESPPRPPHARNGSGHSEPRPLGEIIEESERTPSPGSPTLRHPKGRLEESFAAAVKEHSPARNGLPNGNGQGLPVKGAVRNNIRQTNGSKSPSSRDSPDAETYDGVGEDEAPRSPTRRAHQRVTSKPLHGGTASMATGQEAKGSNGRKKGESTAQANGTSKQLQPGEVLYENLRNKSGDNLASIKPDEGYYASLQQHEDKPQNQVARQRRDSDLTSGRRAGEGWGRSAIRFAPLNVPVQRRLQTLLVLIHTLSIAGSLAIFLFLCGIPLLWPILVPYLLYVLLSRAGVDGNLSQRSNWLRKSKIWSLFGSYFPARLHRSQELEPTRKYIFGYHPHGIISHGAFAAFATEALGFGQLFPGITNTLLTLDSNFRIPLYRDYALRMGLASVSRESCENILSRGGPNGEGMGRAITIVVGGARESLDAKPYTLRLVLKRRKGFVKLAIRTGADLVPVLAFGENDIYDQFDSEGHPWIHKGQMLVKKLMGFTVSPRS